MYTSFSAYLPKQRLLKTSSIDFKHRSDQSIPAIITLNISLNYETVTLKQGA